MYHLLTYGLGEPRDLGNGVHVNSFANDPTFKHALASGDLITALGRIADVSPFFPSFKTPAGWTPPANLAIPIDFVPVAGEQLIIPAGVIVPAGIALPDFITLIKPVTPTEPTEPTKPITPRQTD